MLSDRKLEWGSNPHLARLPVLPEPPRDVEEESLNIEMNIFVKKAKVKNKKGITTYHKNSIFYILSEEIPRQYSIPRENLLFIRI
jgi:hypothetical protein